MADDKVKVRIKPLHSIGGVGDAGDVVMMSVEDVNYYLKEGYIEILTPADAPPPAPPGPPVAKATSRQIADEECGDLGEEVEDHAIMKPQSKRVSTRKK